MGRNRILVDFDGVIGDVITPALERAYSERLLPRKILYSEVDRWHWTFGDFSLEILIEYLKDEKFTKLIMPYDRAIKSLQRIAFVDSVHIATACPPEGDEYRKEWLFGWWVNIDRYINTWEIDKSTLEGDILIDDSAENVNSWAKTGRIAILMRQPWNIKERIHPKVITAWNWSDVMRYLYEARCY